MAEFEQMLREVFGDSISKITQLQNDGMKKLTTKLAEMAKESVKDDVTRLNTEIAELRSRVDQLEAERSVKKIEVEQSF